jgi:hypothetical protein
MPHEHYASRRHPEFVVLEIGPGLGALIVHTDDTMHGVEIEISPESDEARRSHKQVLERSVGGSPAYTALFDQLAADTYTLWTDGVARVRGVAVRSEEITELRWPTEALAAA